jgi:hypothetical protein
VYDHKVGCVDGENIEKLHDVTLEECEIKCSANEKCLGVEYFTPSGAKKTNSGYKENDCNLSSSINTAGCNYKYHQLNLWTKSNVCKANAVEEKAEESGAATYVGCFEDKSQRTLPTNLNLGKGQSLENCVAAAKAKGLRYAGL